MIKFNLVISSCAAMLCPTNQVCSEQPTGPVCTCTGNKVGTFCQYGKFNSKKTVQSLLSFILYI